MGSNVTWFFSFCGTRNKMKDTLVSTIDIEQEVEGIEENQPDIKGKCEVHEPPSRFFKRPFSVPSPAKHMRALLARVLGFFKWKEQGSMTRLQKSFGYVTGEQVKELGEQVEGGTGLDKSFGFSKNLIKMYELGSMVGFGHFSYTCIATFKKGKLEGHHAAVKVISKAKMATAIAIDDVRREVKILRALKGHNNIVKFYDAYEDHDNVYIVMEYCAGGELLDSILARGGKYPEDDARTNFMFISSDEDSQMKAIDFGLSDYVKPDQRLNDIVGTKYHVAPEVLHRSYSTEADMWNVGVIAYVLLTGTRPFWAQTASGIFRAVLRSDPSFDESPWPSLSTEAKDFVKRLLNKDHRKRMTAAQALRESLIHSKQMFHHVYSSMCHPLLSIADHLWLRNYNDLRVPLDILTFKLMKAYMHSSTLRKSALGALSKTLTPEDLSYMEEQFEQLEPDGSGTIGLENIKTALMKNATDAMKEGRYEDLLASLNALQYRRMAFKEFCAATLCVHQLEALDQWEQQSRYAYELFDKDGNKVVITEELASELDLGPSVLVHAFLRDWIRQTDGKLSFVGFVKLLHGVSGRTLRKVNDSTLQ
ncbi:putative protein kinase CAMK-CDPK family [Rosa chinensis]|uniref:non-specific serine/threonine protein kinase n=1 Tax=Rosa chinensis TaxID=74649 RepID=A0A2P6RNA1_ROSCH|nr:putative protein kinase CAMK-CDPK family [Rosa chinensis]